MKIANVDYDHSGFRKYFQDKIRDSLLYLIKCSGSDLLIPEDFQLRWNICGAHYLAVCAAEKENRELCINYLKYAERQSKYHGGKYHDGIEVTALDYQLQSEFDINMILLTLSADDKGVGVGFQNMDNVIEEKEKVNNALSLLEIFDNISYHECLTFIDTIYLTGSTKGYYIRSGCSFNLWGLVFLYAESKNTVPYYIEHIVHECAHHALNVINADDFIVENDPDERFKAPFREDARPMIGIFHALFVLSRISQSLYKFVRHYDGEYNVEFSNRLTTSINKYHDALSIVEDYAKLTPIGNELLEDIKNSMSGIKNNG
ncbi:HEXXH motif-containing putative peptide modification protein [Xenorhabdus sp. KJ12.1]|uniref:aKG-HExxH-type peptide beta-hydroxylase n=1 Tax=Xenorhabdus sp. KJ12.1 TaxID=1851571 RepID=UPI000C040BDA|nr:HEXXH motif-containing putative peptide modification protein [Xenorhabdus sp. KJ12.1]PHM72396.1 HEXXH motif domain-containing protein [Xenorhabdus sp. KJ12.1]